MVVLVWFSPYPLSRSPTLGCRHGAYITLYVANRPSTWSFDAARVEERNDREMNGRTLSQHVVPLGPRSVQKADIERC